MFSARLINHSDTLMLNICDADLLGRTLKRDNFTLKISEKCYAEKVVDKEEAKDLLHGWKRDNFFVCKYGNWITRGSQRD